jgi:hypothetical protein
MPDNTGSITIQKKSIISFLVSPIIFTLVLLATFGGSFWIFFASLAAMSFIEYLYGPSRLKRAFFSLIFIGLFLLLAHYTVGKIAIGYLEQKFPITAKVLPRAIFGKDLQLANTITPAAPEARLLLLKKQEEIEKSKVLEQVAANLKAGKFEDARKWIEYADKEREKTNKIVGIIKEEANKKNIGASTAPPPIHHVPLGFGDESFTLNAKQRSKIFKIPGNATYMIYSHNVGDYILYYDDGTILEVKDKINQEFPIKTEPSFSIAALNDNMAFTISVKPRKKI